MSCDTMAPTQSELERQEGVLLPETCMVVRRIFWPLHDTHVSIQLDSLLPRASTTVQLIARELYRALC